MICPSIATDREPKTVTRIITVRMPAELHEAISLAADGWQISMNQWCVDALQEMAERDEMVVLSAQTHTP